MSNDIGKIGWVDLSTADAVSLKDYYAAVVGSSVEPTDMGGYEDFTLVAPQSGDAVAGVCHARGDNASMPKGWLIYFVVGDMDESLAESERRGGRVLVEPRSHGDSRFCVIEDPDGNAAALYQP